MSLCCDVLKALRGKTLVTAESLTGGGIGAALTQVPGSSEVYKGGVICYTNWVKEKILGVPAWERSSSAIRTRRIPTQGNITLPATGKRCETRRLMPR